MLFLPDKKILTCQFNLSQITQTTNNNCYNYLSIVQFNDSNATTQHTMTFDQILFIYGTPYQIMGCGKDVSGEGICPSGMKCQCGECKYELASNKDAWIYPCCNCSGYYIKGIKIGSISINDLETKTCFSKVRQKLIKKMYYINPSGERFNIQNIAFGMETDPDFHVSDKHMRKWDEIKGTNPKDQNPKVYMMLNDCLYCS